MKPRLARMSRLRTDPRDGQLVLLSPERGLRLSESAGAIVSLCDGRRTVPEIAIELASRFEADRTRVEADVTALVADLKRRGLVTDSQSDPGPGPGADCASNSDSDPEAAAHGELGEDAPYTLVAELTHRCALACPYCSNPRALVSGHEELSTNEWIRVLDEATRLGVMQVHLSGGEPLARSDVELLARHARSLDLYVNLVTSGVPLDRPRLERLAPSLDHVQLSLQDTKPERADVLAGVESHAAKLRVAEWVKDVGLPLTINVVLHRANIDHLAEIVELAARLRADRLELANVQLVSWALANEGELLPTRDQVERARATAMEAKARLAGTMAVVFVLPDWHAERPRACMDGWGRRFVVIAPDGAVLPCHAARVLPLPFDNVRSGPLARLWREGAAMRAFRGEDWMREPCRSCDRRGTDFGGCRCQAFALTGDAREADPACRLAPRHDLVLAARRIAEERFSSEERREPRWVHRGRG